MTQGFIGFVTQCVEHKYVKVIALDVKTKKRLLIKVYLDEEDYAIAVKCHDHNAPVKFEGELVDERYICNPKHNMPKKISSIKEVVLFLPVDDNMMY